MRRALLAALVALALAVPASASATIVPQQGMAGVKLGMTKAEVRAVLGPPGGITRGTNEFGSYTEFRYPYLLRVTFQGNVEATAVWTTGRRERTAAGAGVGSSESQLRALHPGLRCRTEGGVFRHCFFGRFQAGKRVTDFQIRGGAVRRVVVGFVID